MESLEPGLVTIIMPVQTGHDSPSVKAKKVRVGIFEFTVSSDHDTIAFTVDLTGRVPRIDFCGRNPSPDDQDAG